MMMLDRLLKNIKLNNQKTQAEEKPVSDNPTETMEDYKVKRGMFDLLQIVKNGGHYLVPEWQDPFANMIKEDDDEYYLIVPNIALLFDDCISKLFESYYLLELIDLGSCYIGHYDEPYCLWHISKRKTETIKISIFYGDAHPEKDEKSFENYALKLPNKYTDTFVEYCSLVSAWINVPIETPKNVRYKYEFNVISYSELDVERVYAKYYRGDNVDVRSFLRNADLVQLKDLATIKVPHMVLNGDKSKTVKLINNQRVPKYPFDPSKDAVNFLETTEIVHKGDIVAYRFSKECYLLNEEPTFDLYTCYPIIKADIVSPEYLYLYLNSTIAKRIWEELTIHGRGGTLYLLHEVFDDLPDSPDYPGLPDLLNYSEFQAFPVPIPQKNNQYYIDKFNRIANPSLDDSLPVGIDFSESAVLNSKILDRIQINDIILERLISRDMEEINTCFSNKAYKATLILCGSVLEAVLLRWLSELNNINLFDKNNKLRIKRTQWDRISHDYIRDDKGKPIIIERDADGLDDYITEIKKIKSPKWDSEAEAAYRIKKARNYVHANLCTSGATIDEGLCRSTINDLMTVISSKGIV